MKKTKIFLKPMCSKTVYSITNTVNGKRYVGITGVFECRVQKHLCALRAGRHTNKPLQKDFDKYGEDAFIFEILAQSSHSRNKDEQVWMEKLKTYDEKYGYNTTETGVSAIRRKNGLPVRESPTKGRKFPRPHEDHSKYYARKNAYDYVESVLTDKEIAFCHERSAGKTYEEIGKYFGVSGTCARNIVQRSILKSERSKNGLPLGRRKKVNNGAWSAKKTDRTS